MKSISSPGAPIVGFEPHQSAGKVQGVQAVDADVSPCAIHYLVDYPQAGKQLAAWLHQEWPCTYTLERALVTVDGFKNRTCLPLAFFACDANLNPLGMVSLIHGTTPQQEPAAILLALYVMPTHRKRGIGRQLCHRAGVEAQRLGWRTVAAYTTDKETFYQRLGWRTAIRVVVISRPGNPRAWYFENTILGDNTVGHSVFPKV